MTAYFLLSLSILSAAANNLLLHKFGNRGLDGLSGALLTIIGYSQATAFDPAVVNGIFDIATLVPGLGFALLALVLWFWYPLHKKQVDANVAALKSRHSK